MTFILPKSNTVSVFMDINGEKQTIPFDTILAEIAPGLTSPTVLDLVVNTSAIDTSKFADVEYRALAKTKPTVTYKNGQYVTDPKTLEYKNIELTPVRLRPVEIANKIALRGIDISANKEYEQLLARQIIEFSEQIRVDNEILAFNNLAYAAQKTQAELVKKHSGATTFKTGAHVQKQDLTTPDEIYKALSEAKSVIKAIGKPNAKTAFDANFKFANGINLNDVVCLIKDEILDLLLEKNGLFASDSGFEAFKNLHIQSILGIKVIPTSNLPDGVNFLMFTTGRMGALAFNKIGIGDWFKFSYDPDWELDQRLHCARQQVLGIVYETLIIASFNTSTDIKLIDKYGVSEFSNRMLSTPEVFNLKENSNFNQAARDAKRQLKEEYKQKQQEIKDQKEQIKQEQANNENEE